MTKAMTPAKTNLLPKTTAGLMPSPRWLLRSRRSSGSNPKATQARVIEANVTPTLSKPKSTCETMRAAMARITMDEPRYAKWATRLDRPLMPTRRTPRILRTYFQPLVIAMVLANYRTLGTRVQRAQTQVGSGRRFGVGPVSVRVTSNDGSVTVAGKVIGAATMAAADSSTVFVAMGTRL